MNDDSYDLTIIGGGPAGMFAAFYAGMRNAKTQLIESLDDLGGQVAALYPEKTILDVAGLPQIKGKDLIAQQLEQLAQFPLTIKTGESVTNVRQEATGFAVTTPKGTSHTRTIIVAVGNGAFTPRKLAVEGVEALEGRQLFYSVQDLDTFRDQTVLVAGGGDAAIDQALLLETVAKHVTLLHRRDEFRGLEHMVDLLKQSRVTIQTPYLITGLTATATDQALVTMKRVRSEDAVQQAVFDRVLVSYGSVSDHKTLAGWQIDLAEDHRLIAVDSTMATSVPGVYAIGDGVTYPGKQPLIATGYGEAPVAVASIMAQFFPDRRGPLHSTSLTSTSRS